jgi:hypothetical protein
MCGPKCKCSKHTDTPRTDSAKSYWDGTERENCVSIAFARGLERELSASQAEVERLRANLNRIIKIALMIWGDKPCDKDWPELRVELDQIKATLKLTNECR